MTKDFWRSKLFWVGVLTILIGIVEFLSNLPVGASAATVISGILTIIFRFLTNTAINGTPGAKTL